MAADQPRNAEGPALVKALRGTKARCGGGGAFWVISSQGEKDSVDVSAVFAEG